MFYIIRSPDQLALVVTRQIGLIHTLMEAALHPVDFKGFHPAEQTELQADVLAARNIEASEFTRSDPEWMRVSHHRARSVVQGGYKAI